MKFSEKQVRGKCVMYYGDFTFIPTRDEVERKNGKKISREVEFAFHTHEIEWENDKSFVFNIVNQENTPGLLVLKTYYDDEQKYNTIFDTKDSNSTASKVWYGKKGVDVVRLVATYYYHAEL